MNITEDIFALRIRQSSPVQGDILISEPFLSEDIFQRAAICLVEHNGDETSMGIVLNKISRYTLNEAIEGIDIDEKIPLFLGGPLSTDRLFYIHTLGNIIPDSQEISPGLYINGDLRIVKSFINSGVDIEGKIRFFIGYCGWDKDQLDQEVAQNVWAVLKSSSDKNKYLTGKGKNFWKLRVKELGKAYQRWLLCPTVPHLN